MKTKTWFGHVTVAVVLALTGFTQAEVDGGGGGGAIATNAAELEARLQLIAETQAGHGVARELESLYAAVERFRDVGVALEAGYAPATGCMTSDLGAQGIHYANDGLFGTELVAEEPQLLMYEPRPDGSLQFIGVEYLVFQAEWHAAGFAERPSLFGQEFGLNEVLLDEPFYLLHVWIGQYNPAGVFADWNPLVDCTHEAAAVGHGQ